MTNKPKRWRLRFKRRERARLKKEAKARKEAKETEKE